MTNFNVNNLYQIALDRLRKDRKGSVSPEEFESFLNNRSYDYFQQQLGVEGISKLNQASLAPLFTFHAPVPIEGTFGITGDSWASLVSPYDIVKVVNAWHSASSTVFSSVVEIDLVTHSELIDRLNNAITKPTATNPIGYIQGAKMTVFGVTTGYVLFDFYSRPSKVYFDYYTDGNGNVTYLTVGQSAYTLATGEVSRSGKIATQSVTSASTVFEWEDEDAMNILDMVMTDLGVAQNDPAVVQTSMEERKNNVKS